MLENSIMLILYDTGIYTVRLRDQYSELSIYPKTSGATAAVRMFLIRIFTTQLAFLHLWKSLLSLKSLSECGCERVPQWLRWSLEELISTKSSSLAATPSVSVVAFLTTCSNFTEMCKTVKYSSP